MRFSVNWLKEYVDFDDKPEELADKLTMAGLELEELVQTGEGIDKIVVAEILEITPHPNAEKLVLCNVNDGENVVPIVCGAKNMKKGDKVALATPGVYLPACAKFPVGLKLKKSKIRGEVSEGMLCAEDELGLAEQSDGIMILPQDAQPGKSLADVIEPDAVIEIGVTPNRADCLSVRGVAREVGAIYKIPVNTPETLISEGAEPIDSLASVEIQDPAGCPRYSCRVIKGIEIAPSPKWLADRVEASGIRSINNIVDVTNYVLLEMGQPLHAFDYDLLEGHRIVVRSAENGERIATLDGEKRSLTTDDLLICDGGKPVALAGVMGGADTEVSSDTVNILLESAYFNPTRIRKTAKKTNLRSESSYRFERGVDPNGVVAALDRAAALIKEIAGGEIAKGVIDVYPEPLQPSVVELRAKRAIDVLGVDIARDEILEILRRLGMEISEQSDGSFSATVPTFRVDIHREVDLIEEIARLIGYDRIPATLPKVAMMSKGEDYKTRIKDRAREVFTSAGFLEVLNYSFDDPEALTLYNDSLPIKILNPLTVESSAMRTNLIAGILRNLTMNLNRQEEDLRLFEIGRCYVSDGSDEPAVETTKIAGCVTGRRGLELWDSDETTFFDLKGAIEALLESCSSGENATYGAPESLDFLHPGKSAEIRVAGRYIGYFGELHPKLQVHLGLSRYVNVFELNLDIMAEIHKNSARKFKPLPKFPSLRRDMAFVVDEELAVGDIITEIGKVKTKYVEAASVFDVFKGKPVQEGKKSVAVSLILRAEDRTLTDEEANTVQDKILKKLKGVLDTELRKT